MKLTIDFIKQESCNFDLECIFVLDLSKRGIIDLDSIKECSNLEILNLSSNQLKDLSMLANLSKLQYLNLSCNEIKSLDGLDQLENFKSINLSGNLIENLEEFTKLKNNKNLVQLKLSDSKNKQTNPLCSKYQSNYKQELYRILPSLELIDGDYLKPNTKNLLNNFDQIMEQINLSSKLTDNFEDSSQAWLSENILSSDYREFYLKNNDILDPYRRSFKDSHEEILKSFNQAKIF